MHNFFLNVDFICEGDRAASMLYKCTMIQESAFFLDQTLLQHYTMCDFHDFGLT